MSKQQKNQTRFSIVEILLVAVIIALIGVVGYLAFKQTNSTSQPETTNQSSAQDTKASSKPVDPTSSWTAYSSQLGVFSLRYPTTWVQPSDRDQCSPELFDRTVYLGPDAQTVLQCGTEYFGQISVGSVEGNRISEYAFGENYKNIVSENVTVSGVSGQRMTATTSGERGYMDNTIVIQYVFFTGGKTYRAHYIQAPKNEETSKDISKEFDLMIKSTLKFSS